MKESRYDWRASGGLIFSKHNVEINQFSGIQSAFEAVPNWQILGRSAEKSNTESFCFNIYVHLDLLWHY